MYTFFNDAGTLALGKRGSTMKMFFLTINKLLFVVVVTRSSEAR
jgi:hypothetical protein